MGTVIGVVIGILIGIIIVAAVIRSLFCVLGNSKSEMIGTIVAAVLLVLGLLYVAHLWG